MVRTVTFVDGPALKSAAISGRVAHLSRLMILVSRRWSRSCMFFFQPQRCHRFDVLPDSRYSRYTHEMVVGENRNYFATAEMLCSISRSPTITPRSNSFKS
ncbi:uncharacterized protein TNCV_4335401 [Trichonephila clavipes]|uniref:Uncharacterized protein n=1 Tax=Trichonephila clavipes TaxID=2585209 RepID=A0A8X6RJH6_TRICX|nr:uncharacterized protein TNCV_4335401 [Trichonephila clavipes]